jgi:hypothetical protein
MMRLAKLNTGILKKRLEIFFRALLSVEAHGVKNWRFPNLNLPLCRGKISFSLLNPFAGQGLHRALVRDEEFPPKRNRLPEFVPGSHPGF